MKRVTLLDAEQYDGNSMIFGGTIPDLLGAVAAAWDKAPAEYKDSVTFEIGTTSSYGDYYATFEMYYYRPDTEEEIQEGALKAAQMKEQQILNAYRTLNSFGIQVDSTLVKE